MQQKYNYIIEALLLYDGSATIELKGPKGLKISR